MTSDCLNAYCSMTHEETNHDDGEAPRNRRTRSLPKSRHEQLRAELVLGLSATRASCNIAQMDVQAGGMVCKSLRMSVYAPGCGLSGFNTIGAC